MCSQVNGDVWASNSAGAAFPCEPITKRGQRRWRWDKLWAVIEQARSRLLGAVRKQSNLFCLGTIAGIRRRIFRPYRG